MKPKRGAGASSKSTGGQEGGGRVPQKARKRRHTDRQTGGAREERGPGGRGAAAKGREREPRGAKATKGTLQTQKRSTPRLPSLKKTRDESSSMETQNQHIREQRGANLTR